MAYTFSIVDERHAAAAADDDDDEDNGNDTDITRPLQLYLPVLKP